MPHCADFVLSFFSIWEYYKIHDKYSFLIIWYQIKNLHPRGISSVKFSPSRLGIHVLATTLATARCSSFWAGTNNNVNTSRLFVSVR